MGGGGREGGRDELSECGERGMEKEEGERVEREEG